METINIAQRFKQEVCTFEMAKKAKLKRSSKQWPKTDRDDRLDRAIAVVNEYEGGDVIDHKPSFSALPNLMSEDQAKDIRAMLTVAGVSEEKFLQHKSIQAESIEAIPAQRFEGIKSFLKAKALGGQS